MKSPTILVVDDEPQIRRVLRTTLAADGYAIIEAHDGADALAKLGSERPDLVLLDMNMPGMDGLEVCREIRSASDVPILMLTVRNAERDKVRALDAGADDYVVKPFGIQELLARIRAALRRTLPDEDAVSVVSKEFNLDFSARDFSVRGKAVHLTPKESEVLKELVRNHGKPISHRRLLQAVWGPDYGEQTEYLRVVVNQLRKKIEADPSRPKFLLTEPWIGYRLVLPKDARARGTESESE
jgi:two-component system, OmpR family, KDP operon response regulator KdpE